MADYGKWVVLGGFAAWGLWAATGTKSAPSPMPPIRRKEEEKRLPQPAGMSLDELKALIYEEGDSENIRCPTDSGPLKCFIRRQKSSGTLNGYVQIPASLEKRIVAMHGGRTLNPEGMGLLGITYGGSCKSVGLGAGICYGFDSASGDFFQPNRLEFNRGGERYRTMAMAKHDVRELAKAFLPGGRIYTKGEGVTGVAGRRLREFTTEERETRRTRAYQARDPWGEY